MLCIIPHAGRGVRHLSNPIPVAGFGGTAKPPLHLPRSQAMQPSRMSHTIQFRLPSWQLKVIQTYFKRYTTVHPVSFSEFIRRCVLQSIPDYCFRHEV